MAEVYLGTHLTLERPVAVKVMHGFIEESQELQTRFQREARVVAGLRHPNIVQIYDFDAHDGHPYIVMEFLRGTSLAAYLRYLHEKNETLPLAQIGRLLGALASGLDYAHQQGVIHRDIKPANILLHTKSGEFSLDQPLTNNVEPIITDFGLVRIAHSTTQTSSGLISGTPAYMSPEQAQGAKMDHRTDLYSLGVVLYELLAGRVPFEADSTIAVIYKHINEPPPPIESVSPELQQVIARALAKDPDDRYQTARDLAAAFLDAAGMRSESETRFTAQIRSSKPASVSPKRPPARSPLAVGAVIAVCACLSVLALGAAGLSASFLPRLRAATASPPVIPSMDMPTEEAPAPTPQTGFTPAGVLRFQNGVAFLDSVTISAELDLTPGDKQYEAWLVDDDNESSLSIGVLQNNGGKFTLTYVDPQKTNLLGKFNRLEITLEPSPDDSPNSSRNVAYSTTISEGPLMHIRHLLAGTNETPGQVPVASGLTATVALINDASNAMVDAYNAGDKKAMRAHAETIVNLIVGSEDPQNYSDWDGNGTVEDPGDGYGLLINGGQGGYLDRMIYHASIAAKANGTTKAIQMHAGHVEICIQNLETWSPELRDVAIRIAQSTDEQNMDADLALAAALADKMLNGIDIDGDEAIAPIPGEGGALTAVQHAGYMSDMTIQPGENQVSQ